MMAHSVAVGRDQHSATPTRSFRFGLFEADVSNKFLTRNGVRVKIQDQPFRVLLLLLEHPGEIVSRDQLRSNLWRDGTYVDFDGSLNVILKKLRAALGDNPDNPRFIETVPRSGYRFIAPVSATPMETPLPTVPPLCSKSRLFTSLRVQLPRMLQFKTSLGGQGFARRLSMLWHRRSSLQPQSWLGSAGLVRGKLHRPPALLLSRRSTFAVPLLFSDFRFVRLCNRKLARHRII